MASGSGDILDKAVLELGLHQCDEHIISGELKYCQVP